MSHNSGGRVETSINGVVFAARGEISLSGAGVENTAGTNSDGSVYRTVAARARTAEITFDMFVDQNGEPLRWSDDLILQDNLSVTFVERDGKLTHLLTGAFFTGTPNVNLATGEVSGLSLASDSYTTFRN